MKKIFYLILPLFITLKVYSQVCTNEIPLSFKENIDEKGIPLITMPSIDYELINKQDALDNLNGLPPRFGFDFNVNINTENSGRWIELPNNRGRLWQLEIYCPKALSINLLYDKFYIPEGGKFFIFSHDKKKKIGAFTQRNNKGDRVHPTSFASSLVTRMNICWK